MYKKQDVSQLKMTPFALPFGGELNPKNRWIQLASIVPWGDFEDNYASNLSKSKGAPSLNFRVALGSLIIKEQLGLTDRTTVEQIEENPYLQYFLGFEVFQTKQPFDSSMMTHFRKRLSSDIIEQINDAIVKQHLENIKKKDDDDSASGTLIIDATCTPADIRYPTDISLLNESRKNIEKIIDSLWKCSEMIGEKPRTYRNKARKDFLQASRSKRLSTKKRRMLTLKQLNYLKRDFKSIEHLINSGVNLSNKESDMLEIIKKIYEQQLEMYDEEKRSVADRIVSFTQSHIRPIVRGKKGKPVEFGAKISAALVDGFAFVDRISFDSYNESEDLETHVKAYKKRYGKLPKRVLADQIYQTKKNRKYCKGLGIEISGKPLGRPPKLGFTNEQKEKWRKNECDRVPIEGKFGQLKRKFSLERVMAKLANTSKTVIGIAFLVVNIEKILLSNFFKKLFRLFFGFEKRIIIILRD